MLVTNPAWSEADMHTARDAGKPYDIPPRIDVAAGYEVEDFQAWINCCPGDLNSAPLAEPADDECREAVRVWMEVKRPAAIAQIKAQLDQIDTIKNPIDRKRLLAMGEAYGLIGNSKSETRNPKHEDTAQP
jgi:hypothetical protein